MTANAAQALGAQFKAWARDPDLYAIMLDPSVAALGQADVDDAAAPALADLIWRLECFSKPALTMCNAAAGDIGWALALAGTHRVVGPQFRYRCGATAHGRLPPGNVVLTWAGLGSGAALDALCGGRAIDARQAVENGFATHCIAPEHFDAIIAALADAEPIDPVLDDRHQLHGMTADSASHVPVGTPVAAGTLHAARTVLEQLKGSTVEQALVMSARWNEALRLRGADASQSDLGTAFDAIKVDLPTRRTLQAFRAA